MLVSVALVTRCERLSQSTQYVAWSASLLTILWSRNEVEIIVFLSNLTLEIYAMQYLQLVAGNVNFELFYGKSWVILLTPTLKNYLRGNSFGLIALCK